MKYPKTNGKEWDLMRKKDFDNWRKQFKWTLENSKQNLTQEQNKVISWNCAFEVVTDR